MPRSSLLDAPGAGGGGADPADCASAGWEREEGESDCSYWWRAQWNFKPRGPLWLPQIVRMTWYVTSREEYLAQIKEVGAAYREVIGKHFPAMAVVEVSGLVESRAKVEIETTAVIPD